MISCIRNEREYQLPPSAYSRNDYEKRMVTPVNASDPNIRVKQGPLTMRNMVQPGPGIAPASYPGLGGGYPGLQGFQAGPPAVAPAANLVQAVAEPVAAATAKSSLLGGLSNFNMKDIKSFVDRMGGIEGIVESINKAQKLMNSVQQMAPMIKLLLPGGKGKVASDDGDDYIPPRRRKRRRKKNGSTNRRPRKTVKR
ncbi:hypothetical protein [Paenibacillus sp. y28]|uniref:hypothetical protein n=1 Tax=Paenibacillus sp. y28 TaxID=3129110 RepID=UPI0030170B5C